MYTFSNRSVEMTNNKIKAIKRIAYSFHNFELFCLRILISFQEGSYL
ncbi:transposase [Weissella paramesenteroides]